MLDLGLDVLFKGKNMARLLGGLGVALKISAPRTRSLISAVPHSTKTMIDAVSPERSHPQARVVPKNTRNSSTICGMMRTNSR